MKRIKLSVGLDLVEMENGFYCVITFPTDNSTTIYLRTKNKIDAINKAIKLYDERLNKYDNDIRLELVEEIEVKTYDFIHNHIEKYGADVSEVYVDAFNDLLTWLKEKKLKIEKR